MSKIKNPFERRGSFGNYTRIIYSFLIKREWFSCDDVRGCSAKTCKDNNELKKAFSNLKELLKPSDIEVEGNNRNKRFRYVGIDNDPLKMLRDNATIKDLKVYAEFCHDTAGLIPIEWLQYFFTNTVDLYNIRKNRNDGKFIIEADINRGMLNIELLPILYRAIKTKKVIKFYYQEFGRDIKQIIMHPHFLKEFNGRWHLYGKVQSSDFPFKKLKNSIGHVSLDRVQRFDNKWFEEIDHITYEKAPDGYYVKLFNNLVGLTKSKTCQVFHIHIRALTEYIYGLIKTKPIHHTQKEIIPFNKYNDGEYAEFTIDVELNNEFFGRILQLGEGVEITTPKIARDWMQEKVQNLYQIYFN